MEKPLSIIICGAAGRMGSQVAALAAADPRFELAACVFHARMGDSRGAAAVRPDDFPRLLAKADAAIDFSAPQACARFAAWAAGAGKPIVIGTTGFSPAQLSRLKSCARHAPVFLAPNFSPAVALMLSLCREAAKRLKDFEASISEVHHSLKRDSPSGTALAIARAVQEGRADSAPVPAVSRRIGDIVGEHTLTLAGPFEKLELTHRAHSRALFARGALEAALWLRGKKAGLYDMADLLGLARNPSES